MRSFPFVSSSHFTLLPQVPDAIVLIVGAVLAATLLDELTELELLTGFSLSELAAALSATLAEALSSLAVLEAAALAA